MIKNAIKTIIVLKLKIAAKILLLIKRPKIFAITGSAGKTSTKEFLKTLLATKYTVLAPKEGYNTEIGATLSLFNETAPKDPFSYRSAGQWIFILVRIFFKLFNIRKFPDIVIVEMGADKPGDIRYLSKIFKPDFGVVLTVLPVHIEEFKNEEAIAKEKSELVLAVKKGGRVFLNSDSPLVMKMKKIAQAPVLTFGEEPGSDFFIKQITSDLDGLGFVLVTGGKKYHYHVKLYGEQMIYSVVAAIAMALETGVETEEIKKALADIKPFKGRMNVIKGIKNTTIIDDSYNANPQSTIQSLNFLKNQNGRRIAVLGNMNELGAYEQEGHRLVGEAAAKSADFLVTVGELAKNNLAKSAIKAGMKRDDVVSFNDSTEAGQWLAQNLRAGDIILMKGSQNRVRMEKAVYEIMLNKDCAKDILARQSSFWKDR